MINWILGGVIFLTAGLIIFRMIKSASKGDPAGCCGGCGDCTCESIDKQNTNN